MLEIDDVRLALGEARFRFSLDVGDDVPHVLLGRSGSGKSTLLNLIAGFVEPDAGDIRWQGRSLLGLAPSARPVNTLFQHHNLFSHLTVADNVGLGLHPGLRLSGRRARAGARRARRGRSRRARAQAPARPLGRGADSASRSPAASFAGARSS